MGCKVGILSMQRIFNYGSFLQAYGLKEIFKELGCEVEFVDYHPGKCLVPTTEKKGRMRKLFKGIQALKGEAPIREKVRFISYKRNYAKKYYPLLGISKIMNYAPSVDLLVIGSDEVFNCVQGNINVGFSPELFGQGNRATKVISYAASFGNTTEKKLEQFAVKKQVAEWLKSFDSLSVRDENSKKIIESLTGIVANDNLDPVLIYDFMNKCEEIPSKLTDHDYLVLYGYSNRFTKEECTAIRQYADSRKLKVFCIGGIQECCDRFVDCSPFQVISYFQHADCIITDTFHGTILSIITHKCFASFVRGNGYGNVEKMIDLLKRMQLEPQIVKSVNEMPAVLERKIDYSITDLIIRQEREKAYDYLRAFI